MANSKDVVVTGVSTGIGLGTTKVLVSKGFRVFGSVRKQADADRLQREFGDGFVPLLMDISDADAVHQAAQKVVHDRRQESGWPGEQCRSCGQWAAALSEAQRVQTAVGGQHDLPTCRNPSLRSSFGNG